MTARNPEFIQRFARLCDDAWKRGWHEGNGGNLSYRLAPDEVDEILSSSKPEGEWKNLPQAFPELAEARILMTAAGSYLKNVESSPETAAGIVEIGPDADCYRVLWGFEGGRPSSELVTHLAAYAEGIASGDDADRVIYHAHAPQILTLSTIIPADDRKWTRVLWRTMTETIIMIPEGLAVLEWMVPGSDELATKTREAMRDRHACIWEHHGIMVRASSFDDAFGMVETIEKAAGIYLAARSANGGEEPKHLVSDEQLRAVCSRYGIVPNEAFLD